MCTWIFVALANYIISLHVFLDIFVLLGILLSKLLTYNFSTYLLHIAQVQQLKQIREWRKKREKKQNWTHLLSYSVVWKCKKNFWLIVFFINTREWEFKILGNQCFVSCWSDLFKAYSTPIFSGIAKTLLFANWHFPQCRKIMYIHKQDCKKLKFCIALYCYFLYNIFLLRRV